MNDYRPSASWDNLRLRAELLTRTRAFFATRGFLEVETPVLSADTVVDRYLDPLEVMLPHDPRVPLVGRRLFLQTSPEFGMKRLLASGASAIYQITRAFRAGETGPLHNPEFTLVEWYRTGDTMAEGIRLLSELATELLGLGAAEQVSYGDAFRQQVGIDPHTATIEQLAALARKHKVPIDAAFDTDRDGWLNLLLAQLVEPHLGRVAPTILFDYPASQAALARLHGDPPVAARFELYVRGIELANGYHELLDAEVLLRRNVQANFQRNADGKPVLPTESRLLSAMRAELPDCTGVALGFDRVVMLAAGATSISDVLAFPIERA